MVRNGAVRAIHTAPEASAPMEARERVEAVTGRGLRGDHYFAGEGTYSDSARDISREITFIEVETLKAIQRDYDIELAPGAHRRNVTTHGVALNHLVDERFRVDDVTCEGAELCAPCSYLEQLLETAGVHDALVHRGGLRARIVTDGTIQVGDPVVVEQFDDPTQETNRSPLGEQ